MGKRYHFLRKNKDCNLEIAWTWNKKHLKDSVVDSHWLLNITAQEYETLIPIFIKIQKAEDTAHWRIICQRCGIYYMEETR